MPFALAKRMSVYILSPTIQVREAGTPNARATHSPMTVQGFPQMTSGVRPQERSNRAMKEPTSGMGTPAVGHTSSGWEAMYTAPPARNSLNCLSFAKVSDVSYASRHTSGRSSHRATPAARSSSRTASVASAYTPAPA